MPKTRFNHPKFLFIILFSGRSDETARRTGNSKTCKGGRNVSGMAAGGDAKALGALVVVGINAQHIQVDDFVQRDEARQDNIRGRLYATARVKSLAIRGAPRRNK